MLPPEVLAANVSHAFEAFDRGKKKATLIAKPLFIIRTHLRSHSKGMGGGIGPSRRCCRVIQQESWSEWGNTEPFRGATMHPSGEPDSQIVDRFSILQMVMLTLAPPSCRGADTISNFWSQNLQ